MDSTALDPDEVIHRVKRFKHQSYAEQLKDVHLPSALDLTKFDHDIADNESHFHVSLQQWRQLNLSPSFVQFADKAERLSPSMPLLLHNWRDIVELWTIAVDAADDEALRALLDLLQKLSHDLRTTLSPVYANLLAKLLDFLPRPIAPPALTALLATLSSLFKYLLLPSIHLDLLEDTWTSFHAVLPRCSPEVQRAAAEVWASVLRRLKTSAREKAVLLMANNLHGVETAAAWMLIFACKSVSSTLHTTSPSIIGPIIDCYLNCENPVLLYTLLRRTLTSVIHHCKGPEQFLDIAEMLSTRLSNIADLALSSDTERERLRRMLQLTSIVCSVRQGSRMSSQQLSRLASVLPNIQVDPAIETELLNFSSALILAGDMVMATSTGRTFITEALKVPRFGASLLGSLAELSWGGWKLVALPSLHRSSGDLLAVEPKQTLRLFATLRQCDKLGETDIVWRRTVDTWLSERLSHWELSPDGVAELRNILPLSIYVEKMPLLLVGIVQRMLDVADPEDSWNTSHVNAAWVLSTCMRTLAESRDTTWRQQVDIAGWTRIVAQHWSWSECALTGLAGLAQSSAPMDVLPFSELYLHLRTCIISHSRSLRLSALKILSSKLVVSSRGEQDVLKRCLQGEEVSLDAQGVRERVLRIGRIGQVIKDDEPLATDLCIRWLISQLKVNLRPLWSPAAEALSSLATRFGDSVWPCLFDELQWVAKVAKARVLPDWLNENIHQNVDDDPWEEERTWRDGAAHKIRSAISSWLDQDHDQRAIILDQTPSDRFDPISFEVQLLSALGQCSSLAEKHNRELVPFFLSMAVDDDSISSLPRHKLKAWLTLFSKFANPKALHSTEALYALYRNLLSHSDRTLQTMALNCILTYKPPNLVRHEDTLRHFLDDALWRDELAHLSLMPMDATDRTVFVDTMVRLLFGIMLERKGRSKGGDRIAAVLSALAVCSEDELELFVDLMLKPLGSSCRAWGDDEFTLVEVSSSVSPKQQVGFLNLLGDVLRHLGPRVVPHWPALLGTTLSLVASAQVRIGGSKQSEPPDVSGVDDEVEEDREDAEAEVDVKIDESSATRTIRSVRLLGLRRLADFFRNPVTFDFAGYLRSTFDAIISPRLALLDQENTQAPSALLDVFYLWASRPAYVHYLVDYDDRVLPKVLDCLVATNVKPAVLNHVFDIVDRLLAFSSEDDAIAERIVKPHLSILLGNLTTLVERTKGDQHLSSPLAQRQISVLSQVAHHITDPAQASALVGLLSPLLRKPGKVISEKTKVNLLTILNNLFGLVPELSDSASPTFGRVYELLSHLFLTFRSNGARVALSSTFNQLAIIYPGLQGLAPLLESLNACSTKRVNEPDFDRRLAAFTTLNEELYATFSARDWLPVLYNALHFVQDPEELAIRNNAAFTLRRFVGVVASDTPFSTEVEPILMRTVLVALKNALRSKTELVRAEALGVIAFAVLKCERIASLQEMRPLLAGGDDEASFFSNIHHIQIHRRTRALRRLGEQCEQGYLRSKTLVEIFVPLVEHYIVSTTSIDHLLVAEAINTLGRIAKQLQWSAYYGLIQKYLRSSKDKNDAVRVHVRTLVALLENFHFPMEEALQETDTLVVDGENLEEEIPTDIPPPPAVPSADVKKVSDVVNLRLLPALLGYLENRDENEDSLRIPIALGITNVALHLPASAKDAQIGKLLTVLSQALRSRSQDTRDLVRETMCRIAVALGPVYLPLALRELRAALLRGPHLHVLGYVTHALLTYITSPDRNDAAFDDLDGCIDDIAHVASEVVFGESGKDAQHEDFKTKMREVRGSASRGLDCFALSARYVSPNRISALLLPLRSVMEVTNSAKPMQQVDEVLRRISTGLNANARLNPPELLVLCHTLVSQNAKFLQEVERKNGSTKGRGHKDDYIVQMKRKNMTDNNHYMHNSYRFVILGLDLFTTAYRRSRFDLHDAHLLARLEPFVNLIGNMLYAESEAVIVAALKAAVCILQCPLKGVPSSAPLVSRQILAIIRSVGNAESEVAQTAFKSLATILRECPTSNIKEEDLLFLLELLTPDLEEPSRQASVFALLRAIVARKLVVPELYDVMMTVSSVLVTSQSSHTRESARSLLLQFLLDYPQGAGRLQTTLTFFARNLSYEHASGRSSVLELLQAFVTKFDVGLMVKYAEMLFVALVLCLANDADKSCRVAAAGVIQALVRRLQEGQQQQDFVERTMMVHLHAWAMQKDKGTLRSVAVQVYGLVVDALQRAAAPYLAVMLEDLGAVAESSCVAFSETSLTEEGEMALEEDVEGEWHAAYQALQGLAKVLRVFPEATTEHGKVPWTAVVQLLTFPHAWVRSAACRLLGVLFAASPVEGSTEVLTHAGMRDVADKLAALLKSPNVEASVALQTVKNLFFVGKWFVARLSEGKTEDQRGDDGEKEEEGEDEDEDVNGESTKTSRSDALPWLFSKLSYQARSAQIARRNKSTAPANWALSPLSVLRFFAAMTSHMEATQLERFLPHILTPVYRITEEDTIRDSGMEELKTTAIELQDLVQTKVGTTAFANVYNRIRQGAVGVQQARRVVRATKATTDPEAAAKRKLARNVAKKESRKRKGRAFAESRGRVKRRREA